ncbi:hypothetical protein CHS0354_012863 [Potamilus streckersoni]|uniref:Uncharacterized protein n=1 Tax=Potamilus streckersoni TaxID=2493646 RepID=A0AAE0W3L3_9BIVA|nr:hypothetical protein CHS0354_012863 [Potamilus streckersoni]
MKHPTGGLARCSLSLQEYAMTVEYKDEKHHGNSDGLSLSEHADGRDLNGDYAKCEVQLKKSQNIKSGLQLQRVCDNALPKNRLNVRKVIIRAPDVHYHMRSPVQTDGHIKSPNGRKPVPLFLIPEDGPSNRATV